MNLKLLIGIRKLIVVMIAVILSTIFILTGHIDGKTFGDILKGIVIAYCTANIGEHITTLLKDVFKKEK